MPPATLQHARRPADQRRGRRGRGGDTTSQVSLVPVLTYPGTNLTIRVYIAPGANPTADPTTWIWTEITKYVLWANRIVITRGRQDEQSQTNPSTCALTLKNYALPPYNVAGIFNPRNPKGPWFGQLVRNTPIRVDVDPGTGPNTRFIGFVPSWPPRSDVTGNYKYISIVAAGILRRLTQANSPLLPAAVRSIVGWSDLVAYWPMTDGLSATLFAPYYVGQASGTPTGSSVVFATSSALAGSPPLPTFGADGGAVFNYISPTTMNQWVVSWGMEIPTGPAAAVVLCDIVTSGTVARWRIGLTPGTTNVNFTVTGYNSAGTVTVGPSSAVVANASFYGLATALRVAVLPSVGTPGGVDWALGYASVSPAGSVSGITSGTLAAATVGNVTSITKVADAGLASSVFGHFAIEANGTGTVASFVATSADGLALKSAFGGLGGYAGETPRTRFIRVCLEQGIVATSNAGSSTPIAMGPQPVDTLVAILRECEIVNGVMVETRSGRIALFDVVAYENNAAALTIDNSLKQLAADFSPIDDDQRTRNLIVASRPSGSAYQSVDITGPLGTGVLNGVPTGTGVGTYDTTVTANVQTDGALVFQASYRLVQGTVDESRYPAVKINFSRAESASLVTQWLACDIGSRVMILHPPADLPPDRIDQVLEGYTESFDQRVWDVELNLSPFSPHRIFRTALPALDSNEFLGYLIPTTCTLAAALTDTTGTSVSVTTDTLWSTDSDDWTPAVPVRVDAEIMMVSGVAGAANPQTLTVTRGALDTAAATHLINASLAFVTPGVLGL